MAPVLRLEEVTFVREGRPILDRVDWTVEAGERWVVVGPNGAGKSTLLRLASTYELPTRGRVHVLGRRVGGVDLRTVRPRIGYVSALLGRDVAPRTSALEAVVTGADATLRRWRQEFRPADWARATALLEEVGCGHLAAASFDRLSEGERQRVLLARSLMAAPRLVLLDEPSAGLDLAGRELLVAALSRLAGDHDVEGVVFVTHHLEEVPPGFTHALLLRAGRALAAGPLEQVLTAAHLSDCFGIRVRLERAAGRYTAVADHQTV